MRVSAFWILGLSSAALADVVPVVGQQVTVSIPLPPGAAEGGSLLLELDGYDISAISQIADGRVELSLESLALEPGQHHLLILAARDNGDIDTVAEHTLDVFAREGVRASSHRWNLLLSSDYRFAEHPDEPYDGQSRSHQNGALQWAADTDRGTWAAGSTLDLLYDSVREASPEGERWQMPAVDLRVARRFSNGQIELAFGDRQAEDGNLIASAFNRRGLRLRAQALEDRFTAETFTLHSDPVTSLDADVPPFDDDNSSVGAQVTLAPLAHHPRALRLFATWLDGDSTLGGTGVFVADELSEPPLAVGGESWTVGLDSFLLDEALWLHGEYAGSRFDADGIDFGNPAGDDDAHRLVLQLASGGAVRIPGLDQWSLGFERQMVGAQFYSIGNLLLPNDLDLNQVYGSALWRGFELQAQWLDQHTDVDDAPLAPRIDSEQGRFGLSFTPQVADPGSGAWKWFGVPTFRVGYETTDNVQAAADATLVGYDLDNTQRSLSLGVDAAYQRFSVGLSYERIDRDDRSQALVVDDFVIYEPVPDSEETIFGVTLTWQPHERLVLSPQWQRSRLRQESGDDIDSETWGVQLTADILPEKLSAQIGWTEASDQQRFFELPQDAQRQSSSNGNFDLVYRMRILSFHLRGLYGRNEFRSALLDESGSQWQASFTVQLNWGNGT
jgi:hypothetical protein